MKTVLLHHEIWYHELDFSSVVYLVSKIIVIEMNDKTCKNL